MAEFETTFADLGLKAPILEALNDLGYQLSTKTTSSLRTRGCVHQLFHEALG